MSNWFVKPDARMRGLKDSTKQKLKRDILFRESSASNVKKLDENNLHDMAEKGDLEKVKFLIQNGANPNMRGVTGRSLLYTAILHAKLEIAAYLIENYNIDINEKVFASDTLLHISISARKIESLLFLIKNGANLNIENDCGETPLCYAIQRELFGFVKILVEHGAIINETKVEKALKYCFSEEDLKKIKEYLESQIPEIKEPDMEF